ncbi:MAG: hypothetical protein M0029_08525 [Actinomycetota bacterium]|nr:hypothetical protein [Actinomycetota bacterium]
MAVPHLGQCLLAAAVVDLNGSGRVHIVDGADQSRGTGAPSGTSPRAMGVGQGPRRLGA